MLLHQDLVTTPHYATMLSCTTLLALLLSSPLVYSDTENRCGDPATCLCTGGNRLVYCNGPSVNIIPQFLVEKVHCRLLVFQNTLIYTLSQLNPREWNSLEEIHVYGNTRLMCAEERDMLMRKCDKGNITLHMPCTPIPTQRPPTRTTQLGTIGTTTQTTLITTAHTSPVTDTHTTPEPDSHTGNNTYNTSHYPTDQTTHPDPATGAHHLLPVGIALLSLCSVTLCLVLIATYLKKRRATHTPNIIYNDVYRMTETSSV